MNNTNNTVNDKCVRYSDETLAGSMTEFAPHNVPYVNIVNDVYVPQRKYITISKLKVFIMY